MTYEEVYGTFQNYQKCCASEALEHIEEWKVPRENNGLGHHLRRLLDIPFCDRTEKEWEMTDEAYEAQCYLKNVIDGIIEDDLYRAYWENLKETEFPEWRKVPKYLENG